MRLFHVSKNPKAPLKILTNSPHGGLNIPPEIMHAFLQGKTDAQTFWRILQWIYEDGDRGSYDFYHTLREQSRHNISSLIPRVFIDHNRLSGKDILTEENLYQGINESDGAIKSVTMFGEYLFKFPFTNKEKELLYAKYIFPYERAMLQLMHEARTDLTGILHCHTKPPEPTTSLTAQGDRKDRPLIALGNAENQFGRFSEGFIDHLKIITTTMIQEAEISPDILAKEYNKKPLINGFIRRHGEYIPSEELVGINYPYTGKVSMNGIQDLRKIAGIEKSVPELLIEVNRVLCHPKYYPIIQKIMLRIGYEIQENYHPQY